MKTLEVSGLKSRSNLNFVAVNTMIIVFVLVFTSMSFAQKGKSGKKSVGNQYDRMYDTKTVETIDGEVISVEKIIVIKGMSSGVHLIVKTNKETLSIHLGPEWFIDKQDITIIPKDNIEIKGSRITYEGKPAILAAEIIKGDELLLLRNENGTPVWSGWRRR